MMATGVPKPDAPSKNAPNENAISSSCSRRSVGDAADRALEQFEPAGLRP